MPLQADGELIQRALSLGLNGFSSKSSRKEVIHAIQQKQELVPCYASDHCMGGKCKKSCEWRAEFDGLVAIWMR